MKYMLLLLLLANTIVLVAQNDSDPKFTSENFAAEVLNFEPIRRAGVSAADFEKGLFRLNETKAAVKSNPANFTYADYWNVAMAFLSFDESNHSIQIAFTKATEADPDRVCQIIDMLGNCQLDVRIPDSFYPFIRNCEASPSSEQVNLEEYARQQGLSYGLVKLMSEIHQADIKYRFDRNGDMTAQAALDRRNQERIDSLFGEVNTYVGQSLVGERFQHTMWAVIQHSNVEMMAKYLPVIQDAVENNELKETPLKMLIDRYYGLQYGYQIFGSQEGFGFEMADKAKREAIKKAFGIE